MSLRKKAVSGLAWVFAQQFSTQLIAFAVSIVLARILMPAEFGIIGLLSIFIGVGGALINSGLATSLIRTKNPDEEDYSTVFYFNLVGSIIAYILLFLAAPWIANFFEQPILKNIARVYGLTFIISAFSTIQLTRLTKILDFKTQLRVSVPSLIGGGILGIILAYLGFGVWSLVFMYLTQSFLSSLQLWIVTRWHPTWVFNKRKFKYHFLFGYKLLFSSLLDTVFTNVYAVVIGKIFNPAQLGFYTRSLSVVSLPVGAISGALSKVTFPLFAEIKDDNVRLKTVYRQIMQVVTFIVAPSLIIMAVLGEPLFRFVFTDKWLPAVPYFQILCIGGIMYPFHVYNLNILNIKGRSDLFLKVEIIKKVLGVVTLAIAIPFGMFAIIWSMVIASVLALVVNTYYTGKFLNYSGLQQIIDILPVLLISVIAGGVSYGVDWILVQYNAYDIIRIITSGIMGVLAYIALAHLFKFSAIQDIKTTIQRK